MVRWQRQLDGGRYASISETAAAEEIERGYLGSPPRLTPPAPDLVEAVLDGRQLRGMRPRMSMRPFPLKWEQVR